MKTQRLILLFSAFVFVLVSCSKDPEIAVYTPTPYTLQIPQGFPQMPIPSDNPMTVEGVALGRKLFYEEKLSGNNSQSCASCHFQNHALADPNQFSTGITGAVGNRNAMALINLGWERFFFWDGRSATLEVQALEPVINPIEMNDSWPNVIAELQADKTYREMCYHAFGTPGID